MENIIRATLTKTHRGEPLAVVDNFPGNGAELTPTELRALAGTLTRIAAECDAEPSHRGACRPQRREYRLQDVDMSGRADHSQDDPQRLRRT